jgi:hypothetical protein
MEENYNLQGSERTKHQVLVKRLLLLTELKDHKFAVPVHEDEEHEAKWIE